MQPLDGNAIAGAMFEVFGVEMTTEAGVCRSCGLQGPLAELRVYLCGASAVARCPRCGTVVGVAITARGRTKVDLDGLELRPEEPGRA